MLGSRTGIISSQLDYPKSIANLQLWYDATDINTLLNNSDVIVSNNDTIKTWKDKSGNENNLTQLTVSKQPIYKSSGLNSKPSVLFDGTDDDIKNTSYTMNSYYNTIISVHNQTTATGPIWDLNLSSGMVKYFANYPTGLNNVYVTQSNGSWIILISGGLTLNTTFISILRYNQSPNAVYLYTYNSSHIKQTKINGTSVTFDFGFNGVGLASRSSTDVGYYGGYISELLAYNRSLTDAEIDGLISYLSKKYNI